MQKKLHVAEVGRSPLTLLKHNIAETKTVSAQPHRANEEIQTVACPDKKLHFCLEHSTLHTDNMMGYNCKEAG